MGGGAWHLTKHLHCSFHIHAGAGIRQKVLVIYRRTIQAAGQATRQGSRSDPGPSPTSPAAQGRGRARGSPAQAAWWWWWGTAHQTEAQSGRPQRELQEGGAATASLPADSSAPHGLPPASPARATHTVTSRLVRCPPSSLPQLTPAQPVPTGSTELPSSFMAPRTLTIVP